MSWLFPLVRDSGLTLSNFIPFALLFDLPERLGYGPLFLFFLPKFFQ